MKLLIILAVMFIVGCKSVGTKPDPQIIDVINTPAVSAPVSTDPLDNLPEGAIPIIESPAWGAEKHQDWTNHLFQEVMKSKIPDAVKMPCKRLGSKMCAFQLISILSKFESSFDPTVKYEECSTSSTKYKDATYVPAKKKYCMMSNGEIVTSMGLLQISRDSANGYGCNITESKQLYDPFINLSCYVKIIERWAVRDGTLIDQPKKGCARYSSPCRETSGSHKDLMKYMSKY